MQRLLNDLDGIVWVRSMLPRAHITYVSEGIGGCSVTRREDWLRIRGSGPSGCTPRTARSAETASPASARAAGSSTSPTGCGPPTGRGGGSATSDSHDRRARRSRHAVQGLMVDAAPTEQPAGDEERFRSVVEHLSAIVYLEELPTADERRAHALREPAGATSCSGSPRRSGSPIRLAWARQLHPEDRDRVRGDLRADRDALASPSAPSTGCTRATGRVRWFRDEAIVVRDDCRRAPCTGRA